MSEDMRFHVIREKHTTEDHFELDEKRCPACYQPTEIRPGHPERRYCCSKKCNAMILEEVCESKLT